MTSRLFLPVAIAVLSVLIGCASAEDYVVQEVANIYDGDTITIVHNGQKQRVRFKGVDTPEIKNPKCDAERKMARQAKQFVVRHIREADRVLLRSLDTAGDRYGRWLAYVMVDEQDLATLLIEARLGRPYFGGKRDSWCL